VYMHLLVHIVSSADDFVELICVWSLMVTFVTDALSHVCSC